MAGVARVIDTLTTVDIGSRGIIGPLRQAADRAQGPMAAMQAATVLEETVTRGDVVCLVTGFPIPPTLTQETDGPPGTVALARALGVGLAADVIILCDPGAVAVCEAVAAALDLRVGDRAMSVGDPDAVSVEPLPVDPEEAVAVGDSVAALAPSAVVSIEKAAPNPAGVYHNMGGQDITPACGRVERLLARVGDVPVIGIGDGGNELGMGVLESTVREEVPYGEECLCHCGDGIATRIGADVVVPATVSNWGAAGVCACLASRTGVNVLHSPGEEHRMLAAAANAGAVDGVAGGTTGWVDGLPPGVHAALVRLLHAALGSLEPE